MKLNYPKKQRGVITVLVAIALPVLLLIMGLALDFGHVFVNKTRLQNALDATALSAAIAVNGDITHNIANANEAGRTTFNQFKAASGNDELSGLDSTDLVFDYSRTLQPWASFNPAADKFAFVRVASTNMLNVTPVLIRVLAQFSDDMPVPAIATAGPTGNNCCIAPFLLCADMTASAPLYGYTIGQTKDLNQANCTGSGQNQICQLTAGNYGLLNLPGSQGGNDIRLALQGRCSNSCGLPTGLPLNTQTGNVWGAVKQGIDYRIDELDTNHNDYSSETAYVDYLADGGNGSRVMAAPIGDCTQMFKPGTTELPKVGMACVFFSRHPFTAPGGEKYVSAQITDSCKVSGAWNPSNPVLNGPYKIVLFKSPGSTDS